jgi:hypothetical protein
MNNVLNDVKINTDAQSYPQEMVLGWEVPKQNSQKLLFLPRHPKGKQISNQHQTKRESDLFF